MDEPSVILIVLVVILTSLVLAFIYLGGTILILVSSWVPMRTRLRWGALSVVPFVLLAALTAIAATLPGKSATPSGATGHFGDAFTPVALVAGLMVVAAVVANWVIFRRFRTVFPRASKSPTS
jgi:hypothetical protein